MIVEKRAVAVRAIKATLDNDTHEFRSVTLLTKRRIDRPRKRVAPERLDPLCVTPADLYSAPLRERIRRLLYPWRAHHGVVVFELVYRPDLTEKLDASGLEKQHAIQKVAVPEAEIKALHSLATALAVNAGRVLSLAEIRDAVAERSKALTTSDFVDSLTRDCESTRLEAEAPIRLAETVTSPVAKHQAARWLASTFSAGRSEKEFRNAAETPTAPLGDPSGPATRRPPRSSRSGE